MIDKTKTDILAYCGDAKETNALAAAKSPTEPNGNNSVSAHTPGPWTIERYGDGSSLVIHSDADNRICFMATAGETGSRAEIKANARLIAAAPELLGALRFILAFYEPGQRHLDTEAWKVAEASARHAMAKATGATP